MKKFLGIIVILVGVYFAIQYGMNAHVNGAHRFLEDTGFTEVKKLDVLTISQAIEFEVMTKENVLDTVYVSVTKTGGYAIRYYKNSVFEE